MSSETNNGRYNLSLTTLLIGVPVLVGASCYYLYSSRSKGSSTSGKGSSSSSSSNEIKEKKPLSPLEQIMQIKQSGNQNYSRKNYDVAIEHYTNGIEQSKTITPPVKSEDLAIFYQNRAACYEALNKYEQVVADCNQAIDLNKSYIKAYIRRAKAHEKLKDYEKAMVDGFAANLLEKFQNSASIQITDNIVQMYSKLKAAEAFENRTPTWPSNQAIKAYFSAFTRDPVKDLFKGEKIKTAGQLQPIFDEACKPENDNDPISLLVRGSCFSLMGDSKSAREVFDKILAFSDSECPGRFKSNALIKKAAIVISEPTSAGSLESSSLEKELERALELLEQAIAIDPENPDIYLHKAQALTLAEKMNGAIEVLTKAIELDKEFYPAIAQKLYIEFKLETASSMSTSKMQKLLNNFKSLCEENPDVQDLQLMYAQVLTEIGDFVQADQLFLNIIKKDPADGSVLISRALLQFQLKNIPDEASLLLRQALELDPRLTFAYEILGSIENQQGKLDEAVKIFETACQYASTLSEFERCFSLSTSARCQKVATELLGMQL